MSRWAATKKCPEILVLKSSSPPTSPKLLAQCRCRMLAGLCCFPDPATSQVGYNRSAGVSGLQIHDPLSQLSQAPRALLSPTAQPDIHTTPPSATASLVAKRRYTAPSGDAIFGVAGLGPETPGRKASALRPCKPLPPAPNPQPQPGGRPGKASPLFYPLGKEATQRLPGESPEVGLSGLLMGGEQ